MSLDDDVRAELAALEAANRLRVPRVVDGAQGPVAVVDGVEVLNFSSNDYLGLAGDPRLAEAAAAALDRSGVGAGASRLVVGNHREHVALEAALADWQRCEGVRLFNSGYAANVGLMTTLLRPGDVVFSDELNHASIIDGCRLSRATIVVFAHGDLGQLDRELSRHPAGRRVIVSESLFSMDGDFADLVGLDELRRRHCAALVLDEAHAVGVHGPEGRGLAAEAGVVPDVLVGAFGKAFGGFGGFTASSPAIAELLWNRARSFVFSTGMPPSIAAAARAALSIVRGSEGDERRRRVASLARRFREIVPRAGGAASSAIIPVQVGEDVAVMQLSRKLFEQRVFAQGIRPPTVPVGTARLRISLGAGHDLHQVERVAQLLSDATR
ncbi:MAG: aminotransferase class I/II-fold pyridoxal phosphate-dependent enzyme [Kofleriaceae bacterium]